MIMARSTRTKPQRHRRTQPKPHTPRSTLVELVTTVQGRQRTVGVRSVRTQRMYFACSARDLRGAELAMLTAERYCAERGFVLVMPANDTRHTRAA
jgi:hypothetical protein